MLSESLSFRNVKRNPDIWSCTLIADSIQQITLAIKNKGGLEGFLTIIYGLNSHVERVQLWNKLQTLNVSNYPWLLTGDFNTVRFTNEKIGGRNLVISN